MSADVAQSLKKFRIFGINLSNFYEKCCVGKFAPHAKFHHCDFKNVDFRPKNRQKW